jgi:general secretion pathway protein G
MQLRCPYCKDTFARLEGKSCPSCGKALRFTRRAEGTKPRRSARFRDRDPMAGKSNVPAVVLPWLVWNRRPRVLFWTTVCVGVVIARLLLTRVPVAPAARPDTIERTSQDLRVLNTALEWFRVNCGRYPTDAEGLKALVRDPGVKGWQGYYIEALYPDRWGRPYAYATSNDTVRLLSCGPDGTNGTADDIVAPPADYGELMKRLAIGARKR